MGTDRDLDNVVITAHKTSIYPDRWLEASVAVHTPCGNAFAEPLRSAIVRALSYSFAPSPNEIERRARWLHAAQVKAIIQSGVLARLGVDLHMMIADFCFGSYALVNLRSCVSKWPFQGADNSRTESISIMRPVWTKLQNYEGVNYVVALANHCDDDGIPPLNDHPRSDKVTDAIYIRENYIGVTHIAFSRPNASQDVPDHWWTKIELDSMLLVFHTDVCHLALALILRNADKNQGPKIKISTGSKSSLTWQTMPPSSPRIVRTEQYTDISTQMTYFFCNKPRVTWYSFEWNTIDGITRIRPCREDVHFDASLEGESETTVQFSLPMASGERVTEVWISPSSARAAADNRLAVSALASCTAVLWLVIHDLRQFSS